MTAEETTPTAAAVAEDELAKKNMVIHTILSNAESSPHEILQQINATVNNSKEGSKLVATVLSGGVTNYSYRVHVDTHPHLCIFGKLSFEYALFNPNSHHDLARTQNEFDIMKIVRNETPECLVEPLACWDLEIEGEKAKLLVTEWSSADEQFGIQFHEGSVDPRIAPKLAETIANLHTIESFDPEFNAQVKNPIIGLLEFVKQSSTEAAKKDNPDNRTEAYMAEVSSDVIHDILKENIRDFQETRDCLIHNDCHVFNILVEKKPSLEQLENFGPDGSVVICDWEQTVVGPIGRDLGQALAAPIGCLIGHMLNGYREASIDNYINTLLDQYFDRMTESGKSEEELAYIYRNTIGWIGWAQFVVFYFMKIQNDAFGVESAELQDYMRDVMGLLGLKFMRLAYDKDYIPASTSFLELKKIFINLIEEEVIRAENLFTARKRKMQQRKSSFLRTSSRRVSDASIYLLAADSLARELSVNL